MAPPSRALFYEKREIQRPPSELSLRTCKTSLTPSSSTSETLYIGVPSNGETSKADSRHFIRGPTQMQPRSSAPSRMKSTSSSSARASPAIGVRNNEETAALMSALMSEAELGAATEDPTPTGIGKTPQCTVEWEVMMDPTNIAHWAGETTAAEPVTAIDGLECARAAQDRSTGALSASSSSSFKSCPALQAHETPTASKMGDQEEAMDPSSIAASNAIPSLHRDLPSTSQISEAEGKASDAWHEAAQLSPRPSPRPVHATSDDSSHCCDSIESSKTSLYRSGSDVSTIPTTPDDESDASMIPECALDAKELRREIYRDRNYIDGYQVVRDERTRPLESQAEIKAEPRHAETKRRVSPPQQHPTQQGILLSGYKRESRSNGQLQSSRSSADAYCLRSVQSTGALLQRGRPLPTVSNQPPTRDSSRQQKASERPPQSYRAPPVAASVVKDRPHRSRSGSFSSGVPVPYDAFAAGNICPTAARVSSSTAARVSDECGPAAIAPVRHARRTSSGQDRHAQSSAEPVPKERLQRSRSDLNAYLNSATASARAQMSAPAEQSPHRSHDKGRAETSGSKTNAKVHAPQVSQSRVSPSGNTTKASPRVHKAEVLDLESSDSEDISDSAISAFERRESLLAEPLSPSYPPSRRCSKQLRDTPSAQSTPPTSTSAKVVAAPPPQKHSEFAPVVTQQGRHERRLSRLAGTIKRHSWLRSATPVNESRDDKAQSSSRRASLIRAHDTSSASTLRGHSDQVYVIKSDTTTTDDNKISGTASAKHSNATSEIQQKSVSPERANSAEMEDFFGLGGLGDMVFAASLTRSNDDIWERAMEKAYEESTVKDNNTASPLMSDAECAVTPSSEFKGANSGAQTRLCKTSESTASAHARSKAARHVSTGARSSRDSTNDVNDGKTGAGQDCYSLEVNAGPSYESLGGDVRSHQPPQAAVGTQGQPWTGSHQNIYTAEPSAMEQSMSQSVPRAKHSATRHESGTSRAHAPFPTSEVRTTTTSQRGLPPQNSVASRRTSHTEGAEYKSLRRTSRQLQHLLTPERGSSRSPNPATSETQGDRSQASSRPLSSTPTAGNSEQYTISTRSRSGASRRPSSAMAFEDAQRYQCPEVEVYERRPSFSIVDDGEFLQALETARSQNKERFERQCEAEDYARQLDRERMRYGDHGRGQEPSSVRTRVRSRTTDGLQVDTRPDTLSRPDYAYQPPSPPAEHNQRLHKTPLELSVGKASGKIRDSAIWNDEDWKREVKALFVIREIVMTERSYAAHLEALLRAVEVVQRMSILAKLNSANGLSHAQSTRSHQQSATHITDLLSLLPRMITVSHKLANLIDETPNAAGVGAAFCAVSVELKAIFVEWSCGAKAIHDALRINEDPKSKGHDQIGLISVASSSQLSSISGTSATTSTMSSCHTPSTSSCSPVDEDGWHLPLSMSRVSLSRNTSMLKKQTAERLAEMGDAPSYASKRRSTMPGRALGQSGSISKSTENSHASGSHAASTKADSSTRKRSLTNRNRKSDSSASFAAFIDERRCSDPSAIGSEASQSSPAHGMAQSSKKLTAMDIAIMPTQRIPRYLLLLRDLHSNVPVSSLSSVRLQRTIVFMEGVAASCDQICGDAGDFGPVPSSKTSAGKHSRTLSSSVMPQATSTSKTSASRAMARARSFASTNTNVNINNSAMTASANSTAAQQKAAAKMQQKSMPDVAPHRSSFGRQHDRDSRDFFQARPKSPFASAFAMQ